MIDLLAMLFVFFVCFVFGVGLCSLVIIIAMARTKNSQDRPNRNG